ncbi:OmpA family protein [Gilvimarinus sp. F26214L]|uniref:OmpA family protein n=1 Tax=Gilvimarinus sp. DZF01 TaxID=3461371 RepID=UPI0040461F91
MQGLKSLILLASLGLFAAGCTTVDPYTGEQKTSRTAQGAGVGAVLGAVVGAASASDEDRRKGAVTGAVAGGAIGAGVGNYMDRQEAQLRQRLQGSGVQVRRVGDTIELVMPGNVTFGTDRSEIRADFFEVLDSVAVVLKEFDQTAIKVSGHTDSTGSDRYNQTLSEERASSVRSYLLGRGIVAGRVQAVGYGERYPVASNDSEAGRQQNRRVELELIPLT